jgi:Family of unknown function (DUF6011)
MPIKCGSCKDRHETVEQVRACYGATPEPDATERQLTFIATLRRERNMPEYAGPKLTKRGASSTIDALLAIPKPKVQAKPEAELQTKRTPFPDVPQGYYATPSATGNNDLDFWFVKRPKNGRWAGRTFVKRYLGGTGSIDTPRSAARPALEAIVALGIEKSGILFADKLGRCMNCGLPLTDEESRAARMGPVCRSK